MFINLSNLDVSDVVTYAVCGTILIIFLSSIYYRNKSYKVGDAVGPLLTLAPGAVISLGIFGTFLGIYIGLLEFDTSDINASIPSLLEGLKTAFITSLFGMFFSLFLKFIYGQYEKAVVKKDVKAIDDPMQLLRKITIDVGNFSKAFESVNEVILKCFKSDEEYSFVSQLKIIRADMNDLKREVTKSLDEFGEKVAQLGTEAMIDALRTVIDQFNARLNDLVGAEFKQLRDAMIKLVEWQENHKIAVDEMQQRLSDYINHMEASTKLLASAALSIGTTGEHLESIDEKVGELAVSAEDIDEHVRQLSLQNEQLKYFIGAIQEMGQEAKEVLPSIHKQIEAATSQLVNASQDAKVKFEETGRSLGSTVEKVAEDMTRFTESHSKQIDSSLQQLQQNLERALEVSLTSLGGQLAALSNQFVEDYAPLTNQLREVIRMAERVNDAKVS
jgi:ABC-type transporter Mla subunit MlaD